MVAPVWSRMREKFAVTDTPVGVLTSGPAGAVLLAMIVLSIVAVPAAPIRARPPPRPAVAVLLAIVLFWMRVTDGAGVVPPV